MNEKQISSHVVLSNLYYISYKIFLHFGSLSSCLYLYLNSIIYSENISQSLSKPYNLLWEYTQYTMCQLIRRRYYCGHPSSTSKWIPPTPDLCEHAIFENVYINGILQRCQGRNFTATTFTDPGWCPGSNNCRVRVFREHNWICHQCLSTVYRGNKTCNCGYKNCYRCSLL